MADNEALVEELVDENDKRELVARAEALGLEVSTQDNKSTIAKAIVAAEAEADEAISEALQELEELTSEATENDENPPTDEAEGQDSGVPASAADRSNADDIIVLPSGELVSS